MAQYSDTSTKSARRYDGWRSSDYTEWEMTAWGRRSAMLSITRNRYTFVLGGYEQVCEGKIAGRANIKVEPKNEK